MPHPTRQSMIDDLENIEDLTTRVSILAGAEVTKLKMLPHKTMPDPDAYWAMVKVQRDLTDMLARVRHTYELAGIIPPVPKEGSHGRSALR